MLTSVTVVPFYVRKPVAARLAPTPSQFRLKFSGRVKVC
jgi:hypothetical protein